MDSQSFCNIPNFLMKVIRFDSVECDAESRAEPSLLREADEEGWLVPFPRVATVTSYSVYGIKTKKFQIQVMTYCTHLNPL